MTIGLAALTLLGFSWPPLLWLAPLLCLAVVLPVAQAVRAAGRAQLPAHTQTPAQRLRRRGEAHPLAVQFGQGIAARGDLRQGFVRLAPHRAPMRLALLGGRNTAPLPLHGLRRHDRFPGLRGRAL